MTVDQALRHINKLCAIKADGARLVYIHDIIAKEVATEREECARIADSPAHVENLQEWALKSPGESALHTAEAIAKAIRSRNGMER